MLIQWPKKKVITLDYDCVLLLLVALVPQSMSQQSVGPMTAPRFNTFPSIRKPCSSKLTMASAEWLLFMPCLFILQDTIHTHTSRPTHPYSWQFWIRHTLQHPFQVTMLSHQIFVTGIIEFYVLHQKFSFLWFAGYTPCITVQISQSLPHPAFWLF